MEVSCPQRSNCTTRTLPTPRILNRGSPEMSGCVGEGSEGISYCADLLRPTGNRLTLTAYEVLMVTRSR